MDLPIKWLKEYVDLDCDINTFMDTMTMAGQKVEGLADNVCNRAKAIDRVVVGKIEKIEKHPDADKLVVCQVNVGKEENIQIVTGAPNVFEGAYVPVALDGSTLANDVKIKKGKLRGVVSMGMMCSVEELGFTTHDFPDAPENGIYIFSGEPELGADVKEIMELTDDVIEFEITNNRPDCYSILGLAREAAAAFDKPFKYPEITVKAEAEGQSSDFVSVEIKNPELCPRYIGRVVKNVKVESSPLWLRHRLTSAGVRPINNIVDITNYVMLEMGQPMHAFDIDTIDDARIIIRNAEDGEQFTTLDGQKRVLDSSMLVISDPNKAVAIAGVMGGENSKVSPDAGAILFESANFNGPNIRITAKKLGMRTDASAKYEKGLDPNTAYDAVNRAVQLVELLGCGEVVPGMVDCYPNKRESWEVPYSAESINKLIGFNLSDKEMIDIFKRIEVEADGKTAKIPTFRPDLEAEADLAEEIARFYGYDKIETTLAAGTPTCGKKSRSQLIEDKIAETMVAAGFSEAMTFSFENPKVFDKLSIDEDSPLRKTVRITNPLGEDFSIMRTQTVNAMLNSLSTNYNRRNGSCYLFETGRVYIPEETPLKKLPEEIPMLTIGMYGKDCDFYFLKGVVEELTDVLGFKSKSYYLPKSDIPYMHPGRLAEVFVKNESIGYLGEVHPLTLKNYSIGTKACIAVINMAKLIEYATFEHTFKPLPKYPAVERDIAMLVDDEVTVKEIEDIIKSKGGKYLDSVKLFDVYKGMQIEKGKKSVAYSIKFRASDRTLTDEETAKPLNKIFKELKDKLGAEPRDK
ncbi:MAG: phenylalanine--tRNA ligase subunit beta [Clostridiales bacterium]|nr:phenylalanine--tRNA ligase subunit beta [Clostridiales bacterium]